MLLDELQIILRNVLRCSLYETEIVTLQKQFINFSVRSSPIWKRWRSQLGSVTINFGQVEVFLVKSNYIYIIEKIKLFSTFWYGWIHEACIRGQPKFPDSNATMPDRIIMTSCFAPSHCHNFSNSFFLAKIMRIFDTCQLRVCSLYSNYFSTNKCKTIDKYMEW